MAEGITVGGSKPTREVSDQVLGIDIGHLRRCVRGRVEPFGNGALRLGRESQLF
jgi:hypothetical protein